MTESFEERNKRIISEMGRDSGLRAATRDWFLRASRQEYSYHFTWLGRPIIQFPQDVVALQEIVWATRPRLIIETGVARGGSLVLYASLLELIGEDGLVLGVDIDIRPPNRQALEAHPLSRRIRLIQGSSIDPNIVKEVAAFAAERPRVMVVLDSNHTGDHVLEELRAYSPLVTPGCYLVVLDTIIEDMPAEFSGQRPWRPGNSPKSAVEAWLKTTDRFKCDEEIDAKLQISVAPRGYLRCVK